MRRKNINDVVLKMHLVRNVHGNSAIERAINSWSPYIYDRTPEVIDDEYGYRKRIFLNKVASRKPNMLVIYVDDIDDLVYKAYISVKKFCKEYHIKLVAYRRISQEKFIPFHYMEEKATKQTVTTYITNETEI